MSRGFPQGWLDITIYIDIASQNFISGTFLFTFLNKYDIINIENEKGDKYGQINTRKN